MTTEEFFVTFGVQYTLDPERGERHPMGMHKDGYAVIVAPTYETARGIANAVFGDKYAFMYDSDEFRVLRERWYPSQDAELMRIGWTEPQVMKGRAQ